MRDARATDEERRSPLVGQVILWVAFVAIAIVGVLTVVVPELSDAGDEEAADTEAGESPPASD